MEHIPGYSGVWRPEMTLEDGEPVLTFPFNKGPLPHQDLPVSVEGKDDTSHTRGYTMLRVAIKQKDATSHTRGYNMPHPRPIIQSALAVVKSFTWSQRGIQFDIS